MTINDLSYHSWIKFYFKWTLEMTFSASLRQILQHDDDDGPRSALTTGMECEGTGERSGGTGASLQISDQTEREPGARPTAQLVHNLQAGLRAGKNSSGGYVFMWAKNALNPTFCVCIFLYLFIIIANVYFNVQISAKYYAQSFKFLPKFLQILSLER